jgi:hypothetical protein
MPSVQDLKDMVSRGGGMILDSSQVPITDLKDIASRASSSRALITIRKAGRLSTPDLKDLASRGSANIIFDFSEE